MSTQNSGKDLLTEMRDLMRRLHYSIHTERAYCDWVARFIRFHQRIGVKFIVQYQKIFSYSIFVGKGMGS